MVILVQEFQSELILNGQIMGYAFRPALNLDHPAHQSAGIRRVLTAMYGNEKRKPSAAVRWMRGACGFVSCGRELAQRVCSTFRQPIVRTLLSGTDFNCKTSLRCTRKCDTLNEIKQCSIIPMLTKLPDLTRYNVHEFETIVAGPQYERDSIGTFACISRESDDICLGISVCGYFFLPFSRVAPRFRYSLDESFS